jgi:hypothetical protein
MAFRIQDPASGLFWTISGKRILLTETSGSDFTEGPDGLVDVFTAGNYVYSLPRPANWKFTADGFLTSGGSRFISANISQKCPIRSTCPTAWVKVGGAEPVAAPAPVEAEPEVQVVDEEAEPEVQVVDEEAEPEVPAVEEAEPEVPAVEEAEPEVPVVEEAEPEVPAVEEA